MHAVHEIFVFINRQLKNTSRINETYTDNYTSLPCELVSALLNKLFQNCNCKHHTLIWTFIVCIYHNTLQRFESLKTTKTRQWNRQKAIIMSEKFITNHETLNFTVLRTMQTSSYLSSSFVALSMNSGNPIMSTIASAWTAKTKKNKSVYLYYTVRSKVHETSSNKTTARRKYVKYQYYKKCFRLYRLWPI